MISIYCTTESLYVPLRWATVNRDCVEFTRHNDFRRSITINVGINELRLLARILDRAADRHDELDELKHRSQARQGELPF
jgi:hypothetical protein